MRFVDVRLGCGWPDCDESGAEGDDIVSTMTITLNRGKTREIDLCKEHRGQLDEILMPLLRDGRTVESSTSSKVKKNGNKTSTKSPSSTTGPGEPSDEADETDETDLVCHVQGCTRYGQPLKSKTGLAQHVIRTHGYANLAAYREDMSSG